LSQVLDVPVKLGFFITSCLLFSCWKLVARIELDEDGGRARGNLSADKQHRKSEGSSQQNGDDGVDQQTQLTAPGSSQFENEDDRNIRGVSEAPSSLKTVSEAQHSSANLLLEEEGTSLVTITPDGATHDRNQGVAVVGATFDDENLSEDDENFAEERRPE
jgi:hypothetical protein